PEGRVGVEGDTRSARGRRVVAGAVRLIIVGEIVFAAAQRRRAAERHAVAATGVDVELAAARIGEGHRAGRAEASSWNVDRGGGAGGRAEADVAAEGRRAAGEAIIRRREADGVTERDGAAIERDAAGRGG